jgi:hypothetical protein
VSRLATAPARHRAVGRPSAEFDSGAEIRRRPYDAMTQWSWSSVSHISVARPVTVGSEKPRSQHDKEVVMEFVLVIYQPWELLEKGGFSDEEGAEVAAKYGEILATPGVKANFPSASGRTPRLCE